MSATFCVCLGLILPFVFFDQLALDIDRDAEDQNRYLDGMVRVYSVHESQPALSPHHRLHNLCTPVLVWVGGQGTAYV